MLQSTVRLFELSLNNIFRNPITVQIINNVLPFSVLCRKCTCNVHLVKLNIHILGCTGILVKLDIHVLGCILEISVWKWVLVEKNNENLIQKWTAVENSFNLWGWGLRGCAEKARACLEKTLSHLSSSLQHAINIFFFQFFCLNGQNKEHERRHSCHGWKLRCVTFVYLFSKLTLNWLIWTTIAQMNPNCNSIC